MSFMQAVDKKTFQVSDVAEIMAQPAELKNFINKLVANEKLNVDLTPEVEGTLNAMLLPTYKDHLTALAAKVDTIYAGALDKVSGALPADGKTWGENKDAAKDRLGTLEQVNDMLIIPANAITDGSTEGDLTAAFTVTKTKAAEMFRDMIKQVEEFLAPPGVGDELLATAPDKVKETATVAKDLLKHQKLLGISDEVAETLTTTPDQKKTTVVMEAAKAVSNALRDLQDQWKDKEPATPVDGAALRASWGLDGEFKNASGGTVADEDVTNADVIRWLDTNLDKANAQKLANLITEISPLITEISLEGSQKGHATVVINAAEGQLKALQEATPVGQKNIKDVKLDSINESQVNAALADQHGVALVAGSGKAVDAEVAGDVAGTKVSA